MKIRKPLSATERRFRWSTASQFVLAAAIVFSSLVGYTGYQSTNGFSSASVDVRKASLLPDGIVERFGRMRKPYGMGLWQFDSFKRACYKAGISPFRVMQTIGTAKASANTHLRDGFAREKGEVNAYCAAVDIRTSDLTTSQKKRLLSALADAGWVGWFRARGQVGNSPEHIHAIFLGYPMKLSLRNQVHAYLFDRNGLVNNRKETFFRATAKQKKRLVLLYVKRNLPSFNVNYFTSPFVALDRSGHDRSGGDMTVQLVTSTQPSTQVATNRGVAPISVSKLNVTFDTLKNQGVTYRMGAKAPTPTAAPELVRYLDCSGASRYLVAVATNGFLTLPHGSVAQREWADARKLHRLREYSDIRFADPSRVFIVFLAPTATAPGHVWLVSKGRTLEATASKGMTSYLWNNSWSLKNAQFAYELPTQKVLKAAA